MFLQGIQRSFNFSLNIYHVQNLSVLSYKIVEKLTLQRLGLCYDLFSPDLHGPAEPKHLQQLPAISWGTLSTQLSTQTLAQKGLTAFFVLLPFLNRYQVLPLRRGEGAGTKCMTCEQSCWHADHVFVVTQVPRHPLHMVVSQVTFTALTPFIPTRGVVWQLEMAGRASVLHRDHHHPARDGPATVPLTSHQPLSQMNWGQDFWVVVEEDQTSALP